MARRRNNGSTGRVQTAPVAGATAGATAAPTATEADPTLGVNIANPNPDKFDDHAIKTMSPQELEQRITTTRAQILKDVADGKVTQATRDYADYLGQSTRYGEITQAITNIDEATKGRGATHLFSDKVATELATLKTTLEGQKKALETAAAQVTAAGIVQGAMKLEGVVAKAETADYRTEDAKLRDGISHHTAVRDILRQSINPGADVARIITDGSKTNASAAQKEASNIIAQSGTGGGKAQIEAEIAKHDTQVRELGARQQVLGASGEMWGSVAARTEQQPAFKGAPTTGGFLTKTVHTPGIASDAENIATANIKRSEALVTDAGKQFTAKGNEASETLVRTTNLVQGARAAVAAEEAALKATAPVTVSAISPRDRNPRLTAALASGSAVAGPPAGDTPASFDLSDVGLGWLKDLVSFGPTRRTSQLPEGAGMVGRAQSPGLTRAQNEAEPNPNRRPNQDSPTR